MSRSKSKEGKGHLITQRRKPKCKYRLQLHVNDDLGIIIKSCASFPPVGERGPKMLPLARSGVLVMDVLM